MADYTNAHPRLRFSSLLLLLMSSLLILTALPARPVQAQAPDLPVYVVQSGDTLYAIALKFYTTVDVLMAVNNRTNADTLSIGDKLYIPGMQGLTGTLTTQYMPLGASLASLGRRNQTRQSDLIKLNRLTSPSELFVGREIALTVDETRGAMSVLPSLSAGQSLLDLALICGQNPWQLSTMNLLEDFNRALPSDVYFTPSEEDGASSLAVPGVNSVVLDNLPLRQGNTWVAKVQSDQPVSVSAELLGVSPTFIDMGNGLQVALGGINALKEPGIYPFTLTFDSGSGNVFRFEQYVVVVASNFDTDPPLYVNPETIENDTVKQEDDFFRSLMIPVTPVQQWSGEFLYPTVDPCIKSRFGSRRSYNADPRVYYHTGLDLGPCAGIDVYAPARGTVVATAPDQVVRGNCLVIDHGLGVYSIYMHLAEFKVKVGDVVDPGQLIGLIGNTGRSTGAHLHFQINVGGVPVNPLTWLNRTFP